MVPSFAAEYGAWYGTHPGIKPAVDAVATMCPPWPRAIMSGKSGSSLMGGEVMGSETMVKAIREAEWWDDPIPKVRVSPHETLGRAL